MLPKRISPCPLLEAVVEIRYSASIHSDAIFGVLYSVLNLQQQFKKIEQLPIIQMPEQIRNIDENLKYQPHYVLTKNENLQLKIGPKSITFSCINGYIGWIQFDSFINDILVKLATSTVVTSIERIGLRYINLFKYQILDKINLDINLIDKRVITDSMTLRLEKEEGSIINVIQVSNNVNVRSPQYSGVGSMIDIDCILQVGKSYQECKNEISANIELLHNKEKESFYSLIPPDFLKELNPEY